MTDKLKGFLEQHFNAFSLIIINLDSLILSLSLSSTVRIEEVERTGRA